MMKTYQWILFDADDTLFHFDGFAGLKHMFAQWDVNFTQQDYEEYEVLNIPLWKDYQNGHITVQQLQQQRFQPWATKLNKLPQELHQAFQLALADICRTLDGAKQLLHFLKGRVKLGIITNGFTDLQYARLARLGLQDHFELVVISEQVGIAKPHPGIFDHALSLMGNPLRDQVLMVGDNPDTDIMGGLNAGLHTCWLNVHNKTLPLGLTPHYHVSSLEELHQLLLKNHVMSSAKEKVEMSA